MTYKLVNLSTWPDKMLRKAIRAAWREETSSALIYVSDQWFDHGQHMEGETNLPVNPEIGWDGICYYEEKVIYIFLNQTMQFPLVWWVNTGFRDSYQRGMVFYSPMEYFVYCIAHELSHIWQNENKRKKWLGAGMPGADCEMDADLYAILRLNEYRRKTKFQDYAACLPVGEPEAAQTDDPPNPEPPGNGSPSAGGLLNSLVPPSLRNTPAYRSIVQHFSNKLTLRKNQP